MVRNKPVTLPADLLIVTPQKVANNGDIVVAVIGDEATVKTFYREKGRIRLQPEFRLAVC